jgi:hypothetical protein
MTRALVSTNPAASFITMPLTAGELSGATGRRERA